METRGEGIVIFVVRHRGKQDVGFEQIFEVEDLEVHLES